jgi:peptide deformylase
VPRHQRIGVRYLTRTGELLEEEYDGFLARIFQHEFDHIRGLVFVDRVADTRDFVTEKEYLRIIAQ